MYTLSAYFMVSKRQEIRQDIFIKRYSLPVGSPKMYKVNLEIKR